MTSVKKDYDNRQYFVTLTPGSVEFFPNPGPDSINIPRDSPCPMDMPPPNSGSYPTNIRLSASRQKGYIRVSSSLRRKDDEE